MRHIDFTMLRPCLTHSSCCRGDASAAGLLFQGWDAAGEGSAAIVYDWERSVLEAIYEAPQQDMGGATQDLDAEEDDGLRRVGGPVELQSGDVHMRILLDHSCVEVYLGSGEVLSTRIYRYAMCLTNSCMLCASDQVSMQQGCQWVWVLCTAVCKLRVFCHIKFLR